MVALPSIPGLDADLRPSAPDDVNTWVRSSAATHGVPIEILRGILSHESGLDVESSRSPDFGNGGGLGQAIDTTAASYGTSQAELRANPRKAVDVSAQILRDNAAMFGGDYQKAAAAYFVGPYNIQEAQKDPSGDWLAAADRLAAKYNQGTVSSYLAAIGAGGQAVPASAGRVLPSAPTGTAAGALSGSLLALDPQRVSSRPGYLYDAKGLELANAGDVPVPAGQDDPAVLQANSKSRLRSIADTLGGGAFGGIKDFATQQIEPLNKVRDFAGDLAEKGVIGAPGLGSLSAVNNAVSEHTDLPNVFGTLNRAGVESGVPTTPLDTLLTVGPGNLAKGAGLVRNVAKGSGEGAGLLSIIPKNKRQLDLAMEQTLRVAEEAKQAVLASGGTMQEARKAAADAMKNLGKAEAVVDDTRMATERAVASDPFTNTGKRLRRTAADLSERMGSGAVEPKKTGWTITNAAGDVKRVETELPHGYRDAEEAATGGAMRRLEANHADQQALNDAIRADEAGARVEQAKKGVRSIRDKARGGLGLIEGAPGALKAPDALSNEADVLDWALKDRANTKSTIGDVARAAKTIGDPFSEARRQFQQGDDQNAVSRKAPNFGSGEERAQSARIKSREGAGEIALRRGPQLDNAMHEIAQGLEAKPEAIGLRPKADLVREGEKFRAGPKSKNRSELGRNAAQLDVWKKLEDGANPAELVDWMSDSYMYRAGTTPHDRGYIAEMERLQDKLLDLSEVDPALNWNAVQTQAEGLAQRRGASFKDFLDSAEGASSFDDDLRRAAEAERKLGPGLERQAAKEAKAAERRAIEAHQATVEAKDLERRKAAWQLSKEREQAKAEARGYHEGGIGKEIAGVFGLPRALSLSSDIGTARDLGLFVGTKQGRQALARGGAAALRSLVHNDSDAQRVISEAEKGSRWFKFADDGETFERPIHSYKFGAGVSAADRVPEMSSLNDSAISRAVEGIHPGIRFSDRAMALQRNVAGIDLLDSRLDELALKYGVSGPEDALTNARFLSEVQSTIDNVNHLRGFSGGSKAKALGALNFLTSPQQMISRLQVLGDPLNFAVRGDMESAKFAAKNLAGFVTAQGSLVALAHLTGGAGRWSVNVNPTSGDFGTVRVGNTRYDTMAGLGPTMRLVSKIGAETSDQVFDTDYAKNQAAIGVLVQRWLENKEQPTSRIVTDFVLHNKLPDEQTAINMLAPSIATGFMQNLAEERGANKLLAVPNAVLNFGGVGTNTYKTAADEADQIATDTFDGRKYDDLTPLERLRVVNQLPEDAQRGGRQRATDDYKASLTSKGYVEPEKAKDNETRAEYDARTERNKALTKANAKVFAQDADLDVQRWFFEDKHGGSLHSKAAVDKALELGLPDRDIKVEGMARAVNASEQSRAFWNDYGETLFKFVDGTVYADKYGDQEAQKVYKKRYKDLTEEQQRDVIGNIRAEVAQKDAKLDAALAWWGHGGNATDRVFVLNTQAAATEYQRLKRLYGESPAKKDYKVVLSKNPR